jgi:peptidoglycan hydrolase CwlO-like protein
MRSRFVSRLVAATLIGAVPSAAPAQAIDAQKINNLKSQQTDIENRIADLQRRVDDASAEKAYCSAEERTEDYNRIRAIQGEILALRNEYASSSVGSPA